MCRCCYNAAIQLLLAVRPTAEFLKNHSYSCVKKPCVTCCLGRISECRDHAVYSGQCADTDELARLFSNKQCTPSDQELPGMQYAAQHDAHEIMLRILEHMLSEVGAQFDQL